MFKFVKISFLSIALSFAANSALIAENCMASDCDQVATRETQDRNENNEKMTRIAKIKASFRNLIKPGGPTKAADKAFDAIFGKDTFSRKVASGVFPKALTVYTTKYMVNTIFENLKVTTKNGKIEKLGDWASNNNVRSWLVKNITIDKEDPQNPGVFIKEITGEDASLLGKVVSNHQLKDITDILAGTILMVWLTNK
mgnify:CR=1 FL=1